ncbi:hypothetical protein ACA910_015677 [Epithemia clementina (nom. ined.)]
MLRSSVVKAVSRAPTFRAAMSSSSSSQAAVKPEISTTFITISKDYTFTKKYLSDPSTYPLFVCVTFGCFMAVGIIVKCMATSPDIRITSHKKSSYMRDWK